MTLRSDLKDWAVVVVGTLPAFSASMSSLPAFALQQEPAVLAKPTALSAERFSEQLLKLAGQERPPSSRELVDIVVERFGKVEAENIIRAACHHIDSLTAASDMAQRWLDQHVAQGELPPAWATEIGREKHPWLMGALGPYYNPEKRAFSLAYTLIPDTAREAGIKQVVMKTELFAVSLGGKERRLEIDVPDQVIVGGVEDNDPGFRVVLPQMAADEVLQYRTSLNFFIKGEEYQFRTKRAVKLDTADGLNVEGLVPVRDTGEFLPKEVREFIFGEREIRMRRNATVDMPPSERAALEAKLEVARAEQGKRIDAIDINSVSLVSLPSVTEGLILPAGKIALSADITVFHVGAVWCAPCKKGLEAIDKTLQPRFTHDEVEFISLYRARETFDIKGLQKLVLEHTHKFGFVEHFPAHSEEQDDGVPYWVAVNKQGKLLQRWVGGGEPTVEEIEKLKAAAK